MSGRTNVCQANVRRARDHLGTVLSGYCPIGLLSCRVSVCRGFVLGEVSVGLLSSRDTARETRSNRKRKRSTERTTSGSYQQPKDDQPSCSLAKNA